MLETPSGVLALLVMGVVVNGLLFYGVHSLRTTYISDPFPPAAQTEHTTTTTPKPTTTTAEQTPQPRTTLEEPTTSTATPTATATLSP